MNSSSITLGTNDKPASTRALVQYFSNNYDEEGNLLIGFPIIGTGEGKHALDALFVSPEKGIVLFDLIEGVNVGDASTRQDESYNKLEAKLRNARGLTSRRKLLIPIHTVSFIPGVQDTTPYSTEDYPVANLTNLGDVIDHLAWDDADREVFERALSTIQSIQTIRQNRGRRTAVREDSRGSKLQNLENSIATLDNLQSKAVWETADDVQRIRGLAGSGKTIVLALKAAYLHAQHPEWRIAVTFNTRSLKAHFRRLITNFTLEQTGEEPDWERIRILNAWGASGGSERDGIYHEFCRVHNLQYLDFRTANATYPDGEEFKGVCAKALSEATDIKQLYDAILVDEAQDFPAEFLRLCYQILESHKRLVYAYDELQNLSGSSLPPPDVIFGNKPDGTPRVVFDEAAPGEPRRDVVLPVCYRNSRPILVTAHALGFGVYRRPSRAGAPRLVQMFDYPQLWTDIGYRVRSGRLDDGHDVTLVRTEESSPRFLEEHSPVDDLVQFVELEDDKAQTEWVVNAIKHNLDDDELRHDDIVVINPDPLTTRKRVGAIRSRLLDFDIDSHLAGVDTNPDVFFKPELESITFTGVFRAKGNEAGMVYIINGQDCHSSAWNLATIRNRLFTAITRSKAWVRVVGYGDGMKMLKEEFEQLKANNFELRFKYPTEVERRQLMIVHRDMTAAERKRVATREQGLAEIVSDLEAGEIHPEDLDESLLSRLREILLREVPE